MSQFRLTKKRVLWSLVAALALCAAVFPPFAEQAQRPKEPEVRVIGLSARGSGGGTIVTITGDALLQRAQTWQDDEGFHVVGYRWVAAYGGAPRGVRVRQVGSSLEIVINAPRGAGVTVRPHGNSLDVVVSGAALGAPQERAGQQQQSRRRDAEREQQSAPAADVREPRTQTKPARIETPASQSFGAAPGRTRESAPQPPTVRAMTQQKWNALQQPAAQTTSTQQPANAQQAKNALAQQARASQQAAQNQPAGSQQHAAGQQAPPSQGTPDGAGQAIPPAGIAPEPPQGQQPTPADVGLVLPATQLVQPAPPSTGRSMRYTLGVVGAFLFFGLVAFGFIVLRQRGAARAEAAETKGGEAAKEKSETKGAAVAAAKDEVQAKPEQKGAPVAQSLVRRENKIPAQVLTQSAPPVLFGAFRIDQEVEKMVRGEAHTIDVLASRAQDDRRAVETSLLKALGSPEASEPERVRARRALEDYGFVARHSAALLLSSDTYERSSAARVLGQIRSASALPFLVEALYDTDTVVRAEAVASLGALGQPAAIGALLDAARRHPELPPSVVSRALTACSVDCIEMIAAGGGYAFAGDALFSGEIGSFEPVAEIEALPEWLEDESLAESLERLGSADVEARVAAAHNLAQFQVRRAVEALSQMAAKDADASVRAAAVTSLGLIGHESVFTPVLYAMADESREVKAAAARAFSRLNFDRADAYVRVLETADAETMSVLAEACVNAGLARQALDRLASDDRRQSYEAFSLLSLVARGGQSRILLDVVGSHPDLNVRLASARLLALQGQPEVCERLRQLALDAGTPEKLREAILEVVSRGGQSQSAPGATAIDGDKSVRPIA